MMKINGFNGTNTQTGVMGLAQANHSVSKHIQNQIANAQQKLQDLSSNEELSLEDKICLLYTSMVWMQRRFLIHPARGCAKIRIMWIT